MKIGKLRIAANLEVNGIQASKLSTIKFTPNYRVILKLKKPPRGGFFSHTLYIVLRGNYILKYPNTN